MITHGMVFLLLILLALPMTANAAELRKNVRNPVIGQYIVVLNDVDPSDVADSHGIVVKNLYRHTIRGFAAHLPDAALKRLLDDPRVAYIEPDSRVTIVVPGSKPDKRVKDVQPVVPQTVPWGIDRVGGAGDGTGRTAWVIDTGIDLDHADLIVDGIRGENFVTRGRDSVDDGNGHGTHVAGTIAAIDNDIDVVGVAAGATVVPVRVLDNGGSGYVSWVIAGVDYVAANASAGDVANLSLGGGPSDSLDDAVKAAAGNGILFAIAAGNDATYAETTSPARVEYTNVFTVSATDENDVFAWFSNFGNPPIEFAAPGVNILSTAKGGGVVSYSGTSMAAPHIAGLLLLYETNLGIGGYAVNDPDGDDDPIPIAPSPPF